MSGKYKLNIPKNLYAVSLDNYNDYKDSFTMLAKLGGVKSKQVMVD